ncbi:MAG: flavin reductase family protein [Gemmataceae bacterium]|nr:flavin reductase family protein [Gemmataceae bacterium]
MAVDQREIRQNYSTLVSCVVPRPIAFVTTLSPSGVVNLAPFSFFNGVGGNPPAIMFSPCNNRAGQPKDTLVNLRHLGEFVVNIVPHAIAKEMNQASFEYPPEISELEKCGFTPLASERVKPPRVAESPVHLECRLVQIVPVGVGPLAANICIGEVLCFHVAEGYLQPDGTVDIAKLDPVARLGGELYSLARERFSLPRPG